MKRDINLSDENEKKSVEAKHSPDYPRETETREDEQYNHQEVPTDIRLFEFEDDVRDELRARWTTVQSQFVDQPCTSIEQADALVADALEKIHQMLTHQQEVLRNRWYEHEDVSTEDLRITLQDYRTFLYNLLDQK